MENNIPPELEMELEELRKIVKDNGGKLPSPSSDIEFWKKIYILRNTYPQIVTYTRLAKLFNEKPTKISTYLKRAMKYFDMKEIEDIKTATSQVNEVEQQSEYKEEQEPETGIPVEEEESNPTLEQVIKRYFLKHFGRTVDKKVANEIIESFEAGDLVKHKYLPLCLENGFQDTKSCVDTAMDFFFRYKDRITSIEKELEAYKKSVEMLTDFLSNDDAIKEAMIRILDNWVSKLIYMGYPPMKVLSIYLNLKSQLLSGA